MANFSIPIRPVSTVSGNDFRANRIIEELGNTFLLGTPVQVRTADGGLQAWDGTTITAGIAGISYEAASNLATTGAGAPLALQPVTGIGAVAGTFGSVPNQSSAVNIAHGAPLNDGRCGLFMANQDTIFAAAFGLTGTATTPLATDVGISYGMTKDTNNFWYVDKAKTGASAVLVVTYLDLRVPAFAGSIVYFRFLPATTQLAG
jgi:hypothetical protein